MDNKCSIHPDAKIIPGHDRFKCLDCNKWYDNEVSDDPYGKWKGQPKKRRKKKK